MNGCRNCRWCKCYKGDYWTPDDYECVGYMRSDKEINLTDDECDTIFDRVFGDGEEWDDDTEPLCPFWETSKAADEDYWEEYAYKERYKK